MEESRRGDVRRRLYEGDQQPVRNRLATAAKLPRGGARAPYSGLSRGGFAPYQRQIGRIADDSIPILKPQDLGASGVTTEDRVVAAIGCSLVALSIAPLSVFIGYEFAERYTPDGNTNTRTFTIFGATLLISLYAALQCYRCFCKFAPHRNTMHPAWLAPRICLFLELHPVWGILMPVTAMLRGFTWFALIRWTLNFTASILFLVGHMYLLPLYREACCYGMDEPESGAQSCTNSAFSNTRGLEICSNKSDTHRDYDNVAWSLLAVSGAMQLCNVLTITWSVTAQLTRFARMTADGKFRVVGHEDVSVNLHKITRLLGVPYEIEKEVFGGTNETREQIDRRVHRMHHHPHFCQPGLFRLLALDPIFGITLSFHDFLSYENTRGSLRVVFNFLGVFFMFAAIEIMQPLHTAWCCYGSRSYKDHNVYGEHYTCEEWVMRYYGREQDRRIPSPFLDTDTFPNGSCLRYQGIGLAAALTFLFGFALLFVSLMIWVYTIEAAGDSELKAARRLYRRVIPEQRYLMLQVMDLIGIEHGMVAIKKKQ